MKLNIKSFSEYICRQLKYHQNIIRCKFSISLEIILNVFKYLTVSFSTKIITLTIALLLFISHSILCEFAMVPFVYLLLSLHEEEVHSSSWVDRCTHLAAHSSKRLNSLSAIHASRQGERGEDSLLPNLNKFILPKTENMSFCGIL